MQRPEKTENVLEKIHAKRGMWEKKANSPLDPSQTGRESRRHVQATVDWWRKISDLRASRFGRVTKAPLASGTGISRSTVICKSLVPNCIIANFQL